MNPIGWLRNLPTEFQFSLAMALIGVCFALWAGSSLGKLAHDEVGNVLTLLGALSSTAMLHGAAARSKFSKDGSDKDLMGG